jgi:hypothetical protein
MIRDHVARHADEVVRERLQQIGYDHVTVDFREHDGGKPSISNDCNLVPNAPEFDIKAYTIAISVLHERLIESGELRFPYVYTKHPDDELASDVDPPPWISDGASALRQDAHNFLRPGERLGQLCSGLSDARPRNREEGLSA